MKGSSGGHSQGASPPSLPLSTWFLSTRSSCSRGISPRSSTRWTSAGSSSQWGTRGPRTSCRQTWEPCRRSGTTCTACWVEGWTSSRPSSRYDRGGRDQVQPQVLQFETPSPSPTSRERPPLWLCFVLLFQMLGSLALHSRSQKSIMICFRSSVQATRWCISALKCTQGHLENKTLKSLKLFSKLFSCSSSFSFQPKLIQQKATRVMDIKYIKE